MPRIKDLTVGAVNKDNREISHSVTLGCSVSTDGVFSVTLEENMTAAIRDIAKTEFAATGAEVHVAKSGDMVLKVKRLEDAKAIIRRFCEAQITAEVFVEFRIFYVLALEAPFYKDADGGIHPNGEGVKDGKWHCSDTGSRWASDKAHRVGIGARIARVKEVRPMDGGKSVFSYDNPDRDDREQVLGEWGMMLQRFPGQPFPLASRGEKEERLASVPYTEPNARFFAETLMGLCRLGDRIEAFMQPEGLEDRLLQATGVMLLPSADGTAG